MKKIFFWLFFILLIFSISYYIVIPILRYNDENKELDELKEIKYTNIENITDKEEQELKSDANSNNYTNNYKELKRINSDMIGWIKIDGTNIDYPVMFNKDNYEYYLNHSFYKNYSLSGLPFASENYDKNNNNILIYAHNISGKTMFAELLNYNDESFYKSHKYILFSDIDNEYTYEVIATFNSKVYYNDEKVFKYYKLDYNLNEVEFAYYITNIKELSIYDTGVSANFLDELITLSTCNNLSDDGRFVLVAKKVK